MLALGFKKAKSDDDHMQSKYAAGELQDSVRGRHVYGSSAPKRFQISPNVILEYREDSISVLMRGSCCAEMYINLGPNSPSQWSVGAACGGRNR